MISLCVVKIKTNKFLDVLIESILNQTKLVDEILVVNRMEPSSYYKEYKAEHIVIKERGPKTPIPEGVTSHKRYSAEHAIGIHEITEEAKNELILWSHPDIFLYTDAPYVLKSILEKYNLDIIGCTAPGINYHCQGYFPNLHFSLVKKSSLPKSDFLKGKIKINGCSFDDRYLLGCDKLEPDLMNLYPYPEGAIDTGHLLYLYSVQSNWRWMAIGTDDLHIYNTKYFKSNVKGIKLKMQKLLYHQTGGAAFWPASELEFIKLYKKFKESEEDDK